MKTHVEDESKETPENQNNTKTDKRDPSISTQPEATTFTPKEGGPSIDLSLLGTALQIIYVQEHKETDEEGNITTKNWEININEKNLGIFIKNLEECGTKKFSIISVLGAYRTGKSFILDLMLRRLQTKDKWLDGKLEGESQNYFTFRHQQERVTTGCWVYSKPYIVDDVALVLMDTQGLFDLRTPMKINQAVFCLSTLISSYQILNIQNQLSENDLNNLEFFANFARSAIELNNETSEVEIDLETFKFQRMEILVRDFLHYDEETDFTKCQEIMTEFFQNTFHKNKAHDSGTRESILKMFQDITCFGLPHPGRCVTKKRWSGDLTELDEEFTAVAQGYFDHIFNKEPVVKRPLFPGEKMTPKLLEIYIRNFAEVFRSGELPEAVSLSHAFAKSIHLSAKNSALAEYDKQMTKFTDTSNYFEPNELELMHKEAFKTASETFLQKSKYGKKEDREAIQEEFEDKINKTFGEYKRVNKLRVAEMLTWLAPFVLIAIIAWLVDRLTDFTCDGIIAECDKLSGVALWIYYLVPAVIAFSAYQIHQSKGSTTMYRSLSGLAAEVADQATKYYNSIVGEDKSFKEKEE